MLALALTAGAFAQTENKTKPSDTKEWKMKDRKDRGDNMQNLNLTDAQKAQIKTLNEDFKNKMQALKQDNSLSEEAKKQKRMEMMKEHRSQLEAVLTPEQRAQWQQDRKNKGAAANKTDRKADKADTKADKKADKFDRKNAKNKDKFGKGRNDDRLHKDLNLTPDQTDRLKTLQDQMKLDAQKIRANESLTADQKKEQMQNLHKKHKEQMELLLTAEQKLIYKNKQHHREHGNRNGITK